MSPSNPSRSAMRLRLRGHPELASTAVPIALRFRRACSSRMRWASRAKDASNASR
jgi:hypothetical protein